MTILSAYDPEKEQLGVQIIDEGRIVSLEEKKRLKKILEFENTEEIFQHYLSSNNMDEGITESEQNLFLCKKIIQANKGTIFFFTNDWQKGAIFQFSM